MPHAERSREARVRRMAARRGYRLERSRTRDRHAIDYGMYALYDIRTGRTVNPPLLDRWVHSWNLTDIEGWFIDDDSEPTEQQMSLREAGYQTIRLGSTDGRMIAVPDPVGAAFVWIDETGVPCVTPWEEAIKRFGPPQGQ